MKQSLSRRILYSNLWPVAAYVTVFIWLIAVNINNLPLGYHGSEQYFRTLSQVDGTAHFAVALSLASVGARVLGRRWTLVIMLAIIFLWEGFEILTQPLLAGPSLHIDSIYFADMLDDVALGIAGMLIGVYFGAEPSNTKKG